ncbi:hypothetical protein ES705_38397 [subsurface metagenome]
MNPIEIAKAAFETSDEGFAERAMWLFTGFPHWWALRKNETVIRCFWRQLRHAKRALDRGYSVAQIFEGKDREVQYL